MNKQAERYERLFPQTGVSTDDKIERMDRRDARARGASGHPMRIMTPTAFKGFEDNPKTCEWIEIGPGRYRRVAIDTKAS